MTDTVGGASLLRLLTWLSPAFPVGAFAWSHGVESAIADGRIRDAETMRDWAGFLLAHGSGWNDLLLFAQGWRCDGAVAVEDLSDLALALGAASERRQESLALGTAFLEAVRPWADTGHAQLAYPVAVGHVAARCGVALEPALVAYAHAFASSLMSAAVRLVPLGQGDMVRILAALEPEIDDTAQRASLATLADLGSAAILSDICAMRHETLSPRLFRS
ncbi:urease accessory protein UreF [Aureimonas frigidaquae]|uniref:urease accessory protein UreF n=1 Tax=Aureimonas frigidaquae TaxID=424757 RepID=UPI000784A362|nr:urease accessory protein UreF [Aureimonas frigidaquae]